jgi:hypothetical protein
MSARRRTPRAAAPPRSSLPIPAIVGVVVVAAIAAGAWLMLRPGSVGEGGSGPGGLPGPIGGSSVAMDVNTLVGKPAPAFTLSDSDGKSYAVTPGQGRPIVLVSHMGIT